MAAPLMMRGSAGPRVDERGEIKGPGNAGAKRKTAQHDHGADHDELRRCDREVHTIGDLNAEHVDRAGEERDRNDPQAVGNPRQHDLDGLRGEQADHHRHEEIIEQQNPAGNESEHRTRDARDIGVCGPGRRASGPPCGHSSGR